MLFNKDTYTSEAGEKIEINSKKDSLLQQFVMEALSNLESHRELTTPRAEYLTEWLHSRIRYAHDYANNPDDPTFEGASIVIKDIYRKSPKPQLGEFTKGRGAAVCREFALLMHVLLTNAGKPNEMVKGKVTTPEGTFKHAWVEYTDTKTGEAMVSDPTMNFVMPREEAYRTRYQNPNEPKERFNFKKTAKM